MAQHIARVCVVRAGSRLTAQQQDQAAFVYEQAVVVPVHTYTTSYYIINLSSSSPTQEM